MGCDGHGLVQPGRTDDNFRYQLGTGESGLATVLALSEPGGFSVGLSAGLALL